MRGELNYDKFGGIAYTPSFHENHNKPWTKRDLNYLVNWYYKIGSAEMSLALGRPENAVRTKVWHLKKEGKFNESCRS